MSQTRDQNSLVDHCTHPYSYAYRDLFLRSSLSSTKSIPRFKLTSSAMVYEYNAFRAHCWMKDSLSALVPSRAADYKKRPASSNV